MSAVKVSSATEAASHIAIAESETKAPKRVTVDEASRAAVADGETKMAKEAASRVAIAEGETKEARRVTVAILAKDKAHCLPWYLRCLEQQTFPKSRTLLYVRTNNNKDDTRGILERWLADRGRDYAEVHFDAEDCVQRVERFKQHEWNSERFAVLGAIRQRSVEWARARGTHYFVADCDNFLMDRETLAETVRTLGAVEVVAPFLRRNDNHLYSNYHASVDARGYFVQCSAYNIIWARGVQGLCRVPVVHCTYGIAYDALSQTNYLHDAASGRHEYVLVSEHWRQRGVQQFLDNRRIYGYLTFAESAAELEKEPWFPRLRGAEAIFGQIYETHAWGRGSGIGSTEEATREYRGTLERTMRTLGTRSVLDVGCGDWQFSKLIDWAGLGIQYVGADCVPSLVQAHSKQHSRAGVRFVHFDALHEADEAAWDAALGATAYDLLLLKDVLQHWPSSEVRRVLPRLLARCKWALVTNCRHQQTAEQDCALGDFRPLNRALPPLSLFSPRLVATWGSKDALLLRGTSPHLSAPAPLPTTAV